ncbi:NUDIX domain-containing protein [Candidatus Nomurabacteria bacterium]|nr:NUDIX domain-containing protein [Candidatus Kaiserbacteria bacterium]MCB9813858.1 NUDIX domain-containing protein [Candidatus Nomurabacteria bacterium]
MSTRFFRAGVGTVIYNQKNEVALFQRAAYPIGVWQFQQGGVDLGESVEETLWRELKEEVGLTIEDFSSVIEMPRWTVYQDDNSVIDSTISRFGQAHRWFFLELKPDKEINLSEATDDEFSDFRWTTFPEAIANTTKLKKHVYEELAEFYSKM